MADGGHPLSDQFDLPDLINGLTGDLKALRAGKLSVREAHARAELAKQILRGVHYVVLAQQVIEDRARLIGGPPSTPQRRPRSPR